MKSKPQNKSLLVTLSGKVQPVMLLPPKVQTLSGGDISILDEADTGMPLSAKAQRELR